MAIPFVMPQSYVMGRCARWGTYVRWLHRSGIASVEPKRVASWWGPIILNGNVQQTIIAREPAPVNIGEATETGNCVMALPSHLRDAIVEEYAVRGKQDEKAASLGIDVSTLRRRLDTSYPLLLELFNLAAASLPLECGYRGPGRPKKEMLDEQDDKQSDGGAAPRDGHLRAEFRGGIQVAATTQSGKEAEDVSGGEGISRESPAKQKLSRCN